MGNGVWGIGVLVRYLCVKHHNVCCHAYEQKPYSLLPTPYSLLLPLKRQQFLEKLIRGLDCPGVSLEAPLGDDHVGKLFSHVNV